MMDTTAPLFNVGLFGRSVSSFGKYPRICAGGVVIAAGATLSAICAAAAAAWLVSSVLSPDGGSHARPLFGPGSITLAHYNRISARSDIWLMRTSTMPGFNSDSARKAKLAVVTFSLTAVESVEVPAPSSQPADIPGRIKSAPARVSASTPVTALAPAAVITGSLPNAPAGAGERADGVPLPSPRPVELEIAPTPGGQRASQKLASLPRPDDGLTQPTRNSRTAIYDISAGLVYMPNGEKLVAHSGLGNKRDDPRYVHVRNRGPTPPNVYKLSMREKLFHGVRAIRMTPFDESKMFGRDGMLAHSYMLGPSGQSNGCVSFKNYRKFLRAFQKGAVKRMIVVPRLASPPLRNARGRRDKRYAVNS